MIKKKTYDGMSFAGVLKCWKPVYVMQCDVFKHETIQVLLEGEQRKKKKK